MPTGYTYSLDETGKSTADWFAESLCRAFGMCIMLRDDSNNLSRNEIIEKIKSSGENYHLKRLKESQDELAELCKRSNADWALKFEEEVDRINLRNSESLVEFEKKRKAHLRAKADLKKVIDETDAQTVKNIAQFGIEQLELCSSEIDEFRPQEIPASIDDYKKSCYDSVQEDIEYHSDQAPEYQEREDCRLELYMEATKEVDRILGE
jgi:hypothetical protein